MGKQTPRLLALPRGVKWSDFEFSPVEPARKKKTHRGRRAPGALRRQRQRRIARKLAFQHAKVAVKRLAKQIAFDLLEIRAETFQENEQKWREQQAREAKAYAAKLAAAFHKAVEKEAKAVEAGKS